MAGEMMMAGSMFGPYGAAAGGALDAVKTLTGGGGGSAGPSRADSSQSNGYSFDNSGWTVSTGGNGGTSAATAGLTLPAWGTPALLALGLLVWLKSRKKA